MSEEDFDLQCRQYHTRLERLFSRYRKDNPNWLTSTCFQMVCAAIRVLRDQIEDPDKKIATWAHPSGILPWKVNIDNKLNPWCVRLGPSDLNNRKAAARGLLNHFLELKPVDFLRHRTQGVVIVQLEGEYTILCPGEVMKRLDRLSPDIRAVEGGKLLDPDPARIEFDLPADDGTNAKVSGVLEVKFVPLVANGDTNEAFYPIHVSLQLPNSKPEEWSREKRAMFWKELGDFLMEEMPKENLGCLDEVRADLKLVRVSAVEYVRPEYAASFQKSVQSYVSWRAEHLYETGKFASLEEVLDAVQPKAKRQLSEKQERDYRKHDYLCRVSIHISGKPSKKKSNRIIVNRDPVAVPDYLLPLLLRLVVELRKGDGGWIHVKTLAEDKVINAPEDYRRQNVLKKTLGAGLSSDAARHLIENDGSGNYRLSTHPSFVTYEKRKLLDHPNEDVRRMAKMLPRIRRTKK